MRRSCNSSGRPLSGNPRGLMHLRCSKPRGLASCPARCALLCSATAYVSQATRSSPLQHAILCPLLVLPDTYRAVYTARQHLIRQAHRHFEAPEVLAWSSEDPETMTPPPVSTYMPRTRRRMQMKTHEEEARRDLRWRGSGFRQARREFGTLLSSPDSQCRGRCRAGRRCRAPSGEGGLKPPLEAPLKPPLRSRPLRPPLSPP